VLSIEDCLAMCDLTEDEVLAIAQHEHIPEIAAAEMGHYLLHCPDGELRIHAMIRDDIAEAAARGDERRALALKWVLRSFVLQHPKCEQRHRDVLHAAGRPAMHPQIRQKIQAILDQHRNMTIATLRPDGWPQATTVGYANDGLTLYFLCGKDSQKAANLARDDRVSLAIDDDTQPVMQITGLSMAAHARPVLDQAEAETAIRMLLAKYPPQDVPPGFSMPKPEEVRIFKVTPTVISLLDYTKGFAHTDLVTC
jgi:nitroimidazol reductase NimA-like FMN-containing flavoprotein (pyridoxamine 5'-phosphate oxidase superfamily)